MIPLIFFKIIRKVPHKKINRGKAGNPFRILIIFAFWNFHRELCGDCFWFLSVSF